MSAKPGQRFDSARFSVIEHYGFTGFPKGDWQSGINSVLLPKVFQFRALAWQAFDHFSRSELKNKSNLTRYLPGLHQEAFTNFYEFSRERTLEFSLAWFTEFRQIANANRNLVPEDPAWWAHAQAHALLCQELGVPERSTGFPFWRIRRWIQYFCDGEEPRDAIDTVETAEDSVRFTTRSGWRAPKWLWAWARKYYGRDAAPWKSLKTEADSMERLDQHETKKLLDRITEQFWLHIDYRLSGHVARVSVDDAKSGASIPEASGLRVRAADPKSAPDESAGSVGKIPPNSVAPKAVWPGTARQLGDEIFEQYRNGKIAARNEKDALKEACLFFVKKDGSSFSATSIMQSLKNRKEIERKDPAPRSPALSTLVKRFANVTAQKHSL